jgi:hypothetical protein
MDIPSDYKFQFDRLMKERIKLFSILVHAKEMATDPVFNKFYRLGIPEDSTLLDAQQQQVVTAQTYPLSEIIPKLQEKLLQNEKDIDQLMS